MRYMVVNLDKQQYFRPVELGAPHGSTYWSVAEAQGLHDWPWLALLAHLLESRHEDNHLSHRLGPRYRAWAGDRVVIVRSDDNSGTLLPEDLQALNALGADVKDYRFLRENYEDLTGDLQKAWPEIDWLHHPRYQSLTQPGDYGWLTEEVASERIALAKTKGSDFHRGYLDWLLKCPGLRPEVKGLLKKQKSQLNGQAMGRGSPAPSS